MKTETRVLARDAIGVYAEQLTLPPKFVRQTIAALKARDRVDSGRPVSPPATPRGIARTILALTSHAVGKAVETELRLGALNLVIGDGQPTLEDALTDMIEEAVGWRNANTNFRDGTVLIGHDTDTAFVEQSKYGNTASAKLGLQKISIITNRAIAQIARELLTERGAA